jgi:signal transduction histidine kinase
MAGVSSHQGLPSDRIFQILEDDEGRLWMSSSRGIFWAPKRELTDVALGRSPHVSVVAYDARDAIAVGSGPRGLPAGCKTRDGRLWFPTGRGIVVFDPKRLRTHAPPPQVVIEEVRVDGRVLPLGSAAALPPTEGNLEVRYTALSLLAPSKTRFRYRVLGLDSAWVEADNRRVAYYSKLPPGRYRFVVTAAGVDGAWNEAGASFAFTLAAPFHRTAWFYAAAALALAGAALGGVRLRIRQERARAEAVLAERTRIAREMHDTLAQSFVALSVQVECIKDALGKSPELAAGHVERTRVLVRESLAEARRAVWALRPQPLEQGDLGRALSGIADKLSPGRGIQVRVSGPARRLPPSVEENLLRIGQEAMTNAVRHAGAARIDVHLAFHPSGVRLTVKDDGKGLEAAAGPQPGADGKGQGLRGMRERAAAIGGALALDSSPSGTEVSVEVAG